jgi:hypothetical protein
MTALRHLRSDTADKRPDPSAISSGQLAINYEAGSPGLFFKDTNGNLVKAGPVHIGTSAPNATPAAGGSTGNAKGEFWLDTTTGYDLKVWDGSAWRSAAGEYVNITGDTMTGNLVLDNANLVFEGSTSDSFETTLTVVDPTADRTITLPNVSGTVVTTGDTETVTSQMIANATIVSGDIANDTIVNANISASAEIAVSKLADGTARQLLQTDAAGTGVEWTSNVDVPGTLDVTGAATFDSTLGVTGAATLSSTLGVTGATTLSSTLGVTGAATFTDDLIVDTNTLFVDASANAVGIGTASPSSILHVKGSNAEITAQPNADTESTYLTFRNAAGTSSRGFIGYNYTNDYMNFRTGGSGEKMRIDSSGRLLINTTTDRTTSYLQLEGTTGAASGASFIRNENGNSGGAIRLGKSRGTTNGSFTVVQNNDTLGTIIFSGADGTADLRAAFIQAAVDGTPGAGDMPGRLVFSTTPDGSSTPTERMRISQFGQTNCFSSGSGFVSRVSAGAGTTVHCFAAVRSASSTQTGVATFYVWSNGNVVNTNNSYGSISDIKLKENIVDANSQWNDLKSLQVRNYNFKEGQNHTQIGLIAQEVELVSPGLVTESPDRDEEGNDLGTVTKSINYSVLYMKAVKALQEAMERIEVLEQRLADAGIA